METIISGWTPEVRAKLRNLNLSYDWSHYDILYAMTHLPELRRLSLMIGGPDEDDFAALARAAASRDLAGVPRRPKRLRAAFEASCGVSVERGLHLKELTRSPPSVAGVLYSDKRTKISAETGALGRFH